MSHQSDLIEKDILAYLKEHENKELLRFLTCGSVDDGKSTLIGRLLHDSKMIYEDQLAAITQDSKKSGTTGDEVDLALLVDGLQSEREQGITIDVAYRYFSTAKRKFIIADTPGHEQYTRNMATGASTCDLAIILVDAREGVKTQTKRHSFIVSLLGIKHVIVAINKMDLMDFSEDVYNEIRDDYLSFAQELNIPDIRFVPMSALKGDNVVSKSEKTPWFGGETLMELLESVQIVADRNLSDFRMPVQYVNRPNLNYRGFAGTIASGVVRKGDAITAMPSGKTSKVKSIDTFDGEIEEAFANMSITLTLEDEIDISRGDVIVASDNVPAVTQAVRAHMVWMDEDAMQPGKLYDFKLGTKTTSGQVSKVDYRINVNTMAHEDAQGLALNEIAVCDVQLNAPVVIERYDANPGLGSFIVIDRFTNVTVGAGMVVEATQSNTSNQQFSEFEIELNQLVRKHFPHWQALNLSDLMKK
ncbi:sulfate adenylyltransferase subunit CysN [Catenovulum adriaticum]|uniref:Sulfate adenylyltransferase subunit 1 n=1 Tax=Catenovulum adriaticum TaxID=2984846 RepID=A0ABY7AQQ9_9ALTE|nr:sulfate adenylyltransferase subunit CysN [Catenovulum sp. TS8]WAJ70669.1 sulfate adenylyltransferase subunit CysN [Catenovulum sp. TS8]